MTLDERDCTEAEPLLADERNSTSERIERRATPDHTQHASNYSRSRNCGFAARFRPKTRNAIVLLLAFLMFTITASGLLLLVPMFRLMEDAICHKHYGKPMSEPIDELRCKVEDVQKELAYLGGLSSTINAVVGLVVALPYGVLADRIGRKPTLLLSYAGITLTFAWAPLMLAVDETPHLRLAVLGSLFFLLGGGIPVDLNTLNAMASDVSAESDRANSFLRVSLGAVCGGLIGPVSAGLLMEHFGPWFPVILVFSITPFVFGLLLFLPETLQTKQRDAQANGQQPSLANRLREAASELGVSLRLLKDPNVALSLPVFLIQPVLFAAYTSTLAQHISTYFGWTLAQVNYLLSPLTILELTVMVVLPWASGFLTNPVGRFRLSVFAKDLLLTKLCLAMLVTGALVEAFSRDIGLFLVGLTVGTFASPYGALCRAVATSYVEPQQTSRLYALMSMLQTGGALLGGPVLARCFNIGISRKGLWIGLPWFYVAGLVLVALVSLLFLRRPRVKATAVGSDNEGGIGDPGRQPLDGQV